MSRCIMDASSRSHYVMSSQSAMPCPWPCKRTFGLQRLQTTSRCSSAHQAAGNGDALTLLGQKLFMIWNFARCKKNHKVHHVLFSLCLGWYSATFYHSIYRDHLGWRETPPWNHRPPLVLSRCEHQLSPGGNARPSSGQPQCEHVM